MKKTSLNLLVIWAVSFCANALATTYEKARAEYQVALSELQALDATISTVRDQLNHHSGEVKALRNKPNRSIIQNYRLQNYLQEAQSLSDRLSKLQKKQFDLAKNFSLTQKVFLSELEKEVELKRNLVLSKDNPLNMRQEAAKMLVNFLSERYAALSFRLTKQDQVPTELPKISEDHQELEEQLLAMADLESKLAIQIKELKSELALTQRQKFLQRELAQLFEEEAFFGEQGFVSMGSATSKTPTGNKSTSQTTLTTNKTTEKADTTASTTTNSSVTSSTDTVAAQPSMPSSIPDTLTKTVPSTPSTLPTDSVVTSSPPKLNDAAPPASHTLSAQTSLAPKTVGTPSNTTREESLRLELKNDRRQKPILDYTSLDQQIHQLDQQILSIQAILGEVKKSKKDIQTILHQ